MSILSHLFAGTGARPHACSLGTREEDKTKEMMRPLSQTELRLLHDEKVRGTMEQDAIPTIDTVGEFKNDAQFQLGIPIARSLIFEFANGIF